MKKNIFVALDFSNFDKALDVANQVKNDAAGLKITNELFITDNDLDTNIQELLEKYLDEKGMLPNVDRHIESIFIGNFENSIQELFSKK